MNKIGFDGGGLLCELGPRADVVLFFDCLRTYAQQAHSERDWSLLLDRLYRRCLRLDELAEAKVLMEQVRQIFAKLPAASAVAWNDISADKRSQSWLNPNQPTLADVFCKYFEHFASCVDSAQLNYDTFKSYPGYSYEPVRLVVADLPEFIRDKNKPLADYDSLEGEPFWLR
ncbi:hypothetical protein PPMP20_17855 [Paraburkholderia phymatum]|uniref:Uncharacterized protein n=1 Tax=Paraburkholderia phymatum (strain DSM 17167 / CIP 108236 / LMG 21445 / STM815) TaxID=391038 RepID=B2JTM8_PARP8|nr:hypothetical protein [Paraburkholderia phymatum]ACC75931.1 conserved hypothetical protein [Paraburkholderia phymatum STM815]